MAHRQHRLLARLADRLAVLVFVDDGLAQEEHAHAAGLLQVFHHLPRRVARREAAEEAAGLLRKRARETLDHAVRPHRATWASRTSCPPIACRIASSAALPRASRCRLPAGPRPKERTRRDARPGWRRPRTATGRLPRNRRRPARPRLRPARSRRTAGRWALAGSARRQPGSRSARRPVLWPVGSGGSRRCRAGRRRRGNGRRACCSACSDARISASSSSGLIFASKVIANSSLIPDYAWLAFRTRASGRTCGCLANMQGFTAKPMAAHCWLYNTNP